MHLHTAYTFHPLSTIDTSHHHPFSIMPPSHVLLDPISPHTHTVIFLHGRGDSASSISHSLFDSLTSSGRSLREIFPSFRWGFPQAPLSHPARFPKDLRAQWFDVWDPRDLNVREELQVEGLRESVAAIKDIVLEEVRRLDGQSEKVILAGISQGGATAVHTLLHLDCPAPNAVPRLGAFIGFCCRLPFSGRDLLRTRRIIDPEALCEGNDLLRGTPMLLEHSVDDPLVKVEDGRGLRDALHRFGAEVQWKEYADGGHWLQSPQGIDDAVLFLRDVLGLESTE